MCDDGLKRILAKYYCNMIKNNYYKTNLQTEHDLT